MVNSSQATGRTNSALKKTFQDLMSYGITYIWNLNMVQMNPSMKQKQTPDVGSTLVVARLAGVGRGGMRAWG